ncbi:MAG: tetratricopeptide repeat protein [Candidatus Aminicenantes bacterium]|jgi:tetratricopeptide (TPR) repeat protein
MKKTAAVLLVLFICLLSSAAAQSYLEEVQACELLSQGKIDEALALLNRKLKYYPNNMDCKLYQGLAYYLQGNFDRAKTTLSKLEAEVEQLSVSPASMTTDVTTADVNTIAAKGGSYFTKGRKGVLKFSLGILYKKNKDYKNAEKRFEDALKADYPEAHTREQLITVYSYLKNYKKASKHLKKLQKAGESSDALTFMDGYISYNLKDTGRAVQQFSGVSGILLEAKRNLAIIHYNQGDYQKALDVWLEILEANPKDAPALRNSGRAYYHLGQKDKGQEQFNKAGLQMKVEKYSPKTIPLVLTDFFTDVTFDFMCQVK